jgi:solute carrier family 12 (sodium/potassium/chloride transporter), member 2
VLTILGVIMYLRFGWVVGNVGLIGTLIIVTLATSITFLTALSISAIATDRQVRAGGAYYMISRSLGIETGGAIGIPLYFAQAISVALYTVGFAESLVAVFPRLSMLWTGVATTVVIAGLAITRPGWPSARSTSSWRPSRSRSSPSLFGSPIEETTIQLTGAPPRLSEGFWVVFAVFFPAVTGIMAGVNMSGDLRDARRAIPIGTLAAVGTGYVIYMTLPIFLSLRADATTLIEDPLIMRRMALWGDAILLGVWGATLSSAMGSILGRTARAAGAGPRRRAAAAAARARPRQRRRRLAADRDRGDPRRRAGGRLPRRPEHDRAGALHVLPDHLPGAQRRGGHRGHRRQSFVPTRRSGCTGRSHWPAPPAAWP